MKTSTTGLDLIRRWEGCKLTAYLDKLASPAVWTIGYGVTTAAGFGPITKGMKITQDEADRWLVEGLRKYETAVSQPLNRVPTQNQFDAMVSLCWNIGPGNFAKSSVVRRLNDGDITGAGNAFRLWCKAGGKVLRGLEARREAERALFLKV